MIIVLVALLAAWLATLALTPLVRRIALRARGSSIAPTAAANCKNSPCRCWAAWRCCWAGGLGVAVLRIVDSARSACRPSRMPAVVSLTVLATIGILDDVYRLRARWKLLGQALAVLPIVLSGCQLATSVAGRLRTFDLGMLEHPGHRLLAGAGDQLRSICSTAWTAWRRSSARGIAVTLAAVGLA